nr:uncharacterized protein LOC111992647 [Quercus suber]XP_023880278.1 uncharacterized protein LOC111992647 [Quercus suber]XP_023880279.1 uncharacterized protein LOC111992647 [Quercus suber]XP_023880280.1 uncharacterized protein LOC111992647 [Quercus suber]
MVETRRSSSASKRGLSSPPPPNPKRSKASEASSSTNDVRSSPPVENSGPGKESGSGPQDLELQSPDPLSTGSPKPVDACDSDKCVDFGGDGEVLVSPLSLGGAAVDAEKSKAAGPEALRAKKRLTKLTKSSQKVAWGKLLSQCSQNPHLSMYGTTFSVGQGRQCNLWLKDPSISNTLCKLRHIEREGSSVTLLEITGGKGAVQVNGKYYRKNSSVILSGGDEVVFTSSGKHAYIFQQLTNDNLTAPGIPSVSILEAQSAPIKGIHIEARSGDPSAVAGASILASLSNMPKDLTILQAPGKTSEDVDQNTEMSILPSGCGGSDDHTPDIDMKDSADNDLAGVSSREKTVVPSPDAANDHPNLGSLGLDPCMDADNGKVPASNYELRPLLRMLAGSSSDFDLSGSITKMLDGHREIRELKDFDPPISVSTRRQAYKDSLQQGILNPDNIEVSFESFPYYLSDTTKDVLIVSTYVHLKCNKFTKYASDLPTVSPRILLSGPAGSEIYQETLAKALAKHFGARLLIVDSLLLPGGPTPKDSDSVKEASASRPERASAFVKRAAQAAGLQHKKPASSVEADITGGSALSSQAMPKQEASTASSKSATLKAGDRVKFVATVPSGVAPLQSCPLRGPTTGCRGRVLLAFEENCNSKIGVRFDKSIPDGNNLGGLCEDDHGFFCSANNLHRLDSFGGDDIEKLAINELFEVASKESKTSPLILFVKDIEKAMAAGSSESYTVLKGKLENLPENVVIIGSHTQMDNRKEKELNFCMRSNAMGEVIAKLHLVCYALK